MAKKKTITVTQLHKALGKIIEDGAGRCHVCVDKGTFYHNCESDGVTILDVDSCEVERVLFWNNDTDDYLNKDGSERYRRVVILRGDSGMAYKSLIDTDSVEEYLRGLIWSEGTSDQVVTMVHGNIRGFASWLRKRIR